ncbi:MAG: serine protease [Pseudomonadota bacterium]
MITKFIDELASNKPSEITALIGLIGLVNQDQHYKDLVRRQLRQLPNFDDRSHLLERGYFRTEDFMNLLLATGCDSGVAIYLVRPLLERLIKWGLVHDHNVFGDHAFVTYSWNKPRISMFNTLGIIDNVLLGPEHVVQKYRSSIPAVFAKKGDDDFTGTSFVATSNGISNKYVLVTAKHNVDPDDGITFSDLSEPEGVKYAKLQTEWILHPELDIAIMPINFTKPPVSIFPVSSPTILSRTITLGYPRIATTNAHYVLAHGGEVNAIVNTYKGEDRILISNAVAPGSSGSPVLDESGLCLGMVVNALEAKHAGGITTKANSAIRARYILDFIQPYCK